MQVIDVITNTRELQPDNKAPTKEGEEVREDRHKEEEGYTK